MVIAFSEAGDGMRRPLQLQIKFDLIQEVLHMATLADAPSHAYCRQMLHTVTHVEATSHVCCR